MSGQDIRHSPACMEAVAKRRWMRRHRISRHLRALAGGYYWLPCPLCGTRFGGHEHIGHISLPDTPMSGWAICPACELAITALRLAEVGAGIGALT
jgi:hypothetical protein